MVNYNGNLSKADLHLRLGFGRMPGKVRGIIRRKIGPIAGLQYDAINLAEIRLSGNFCFFFYG
jgi:hypothetical protein